MNQASSELTPLEKRVLFIGLGALFLYLLFQLLFIVKPFVLAFLLGLAFHPLLCWLERKGVRRLISLILGILLVLLLLSLAAYFFLPPLISQTKDVLSQLPRLWEEVAGRWNALHQRFPSLVPPLKEEEVGRQILRYGGRYFPALRQFAFTLLSLVGNSLLVFFVLVFGLYDPGFLRDRFLEAFPPLHRPQVARIGGRIVIQLKNWIHGLLLAMLFVGLLSYVALVIVGVKNALAFAILAGFLEIIPYFGPIISALLPAVLTALDDPLKGIYVIVAFFIVQQTENHLLIPLLMSRQLTLHPLGIIFFFLLMTYYLGLFGTFVAVPTYACLAILYEEIYLPWIEGRAGTGLSAKTS